MNKLLSIACVALAIFIQSSYECTIQNPQVKVIAIPTPQFNKKYINALKYTITKGNATHNRVTAQCDIEQDLPEDVKLLSKVYVTDSSYKNERLLLVDETPVCKESAHRDLLPRALIVNKSQLNQKCIKKGTLDIEDDVGDIRFEYLIPDLHKEGDYYKVDYKLGTDSESIINKTIYYEWGYLKDY